MDVTQVDPRSAIVAVLDSESTMAKHIAAASKIDRLTSEEDIVRFAIVRNITLEPGLPAALKVEAAKSGLTARVSLGEFDAAQQEAFDPAGVLYAAQPDIAIVALQLRTLAPRLVLDFASLSGAQIGDLVASTLERVVGIVMAIRERSSAVTLVHNFELPIAPAFGILDAQREGGQAAVVAALNAELARRITAISACYIVDVDRLLSRAGYETALDDRYWHIGRAPYSFAFLQRLAREYVKFAAALKGKSKKCLVLDCDNTLWGGVIGEDGFNGIALGETYPGSAFLEFQAAIRDLYSRGVMLAINSKNNWSDAYAVFESHPNSLLRPDHFVAMKINWNDKVQNLREIAAELNIGLDSLVFIDDNAFECQFVREMLPQVTTIELPSDPTRYARLLRTSGLFDTLALSDEDRRRTEMYRSEARRSELKATSGTIDDYLASLDMVLTISHGTPFSVPRIAQLTQKTNQFNLTTRRYSEDDVQKMLADPAWRVYYAELEDRFDKAGIIAVALVHDAGRIARIDTFLMSCRVIGRGVERALLAKIAADSAERGCISLHGELVVSAKNNLVHDFYEKNEFARMPDAAGGWWALDLEAALPSAPPWFAAIRVGEELAAV